MKRFILAFFVILVLTKVWLANDLALFGDEAFYWQSSIRPAISYIDHPPLTSVVVRLGTYIFGDTALGVRSIFLLIGFLFPAVIFMIARSLQLTHSAWPAAGLSAVFPGAAFMGLLAVPDVLIMFLTALFLWSFERGTRSPDRATWVAIGIIGFLGLMTHYRFSLVLLSGLIYLLFTSVGRALLKTSFPWVAGGFFCLGILPSAIWNIQTDFATLNYYLSGRHDLVFQSEQLVQFILRQILIATPFLFIGFTVTLIYLIKKAKQSDNTATLFLIFAATPFLIFFLASPFESSRLTTEHWPLPGYIPLLLYFPVAVRSFMLSYSKRIRLIGAGLLFVPAILLIAWVIFELSGITNLGGLRKPHTGWNEVTSVLKRSYLKESAIDVKSKVNLLASDYKLAAILEFMLHDRAKVFVLDSKKNQIHGRGPQVKIWNIDHTQLHQRAGEDALVVFQLSEIYVADNIFRLTPSGIRLRSMLLDQACSIFSDIRLVERLRVDMPLRLGKRRRKILFEIYQGTNIQASVSSC